jgi:MFS transporter, FLVCR family, MFS-domain-containing protein 7
VSLRFLFTSPEFYMIMIPYIVYVGLFNSLSTLINNILSPYGFSETDAGIAGALLIVVGLAAAAVTSPLVDRYKKFVLAVKLAVPIIGLCYLAFIWAPPTSTTAAPFAIMSILGAASFSLVPIILEYLCEITYPVSPEVTSTVCWSGGQLLGGIFIIISDTLTDGPDGGAGGSTPYNMQRALWFQAVLAMVVIPLPLLLGLFGREKHCRMRRIEAEKNLTRNTTNTTVTEGGLA